MPQRLTIADMVEVFSARSAKMRKNETHSGSATAGVLKFSTCCNQGKVVLPPVSDAAVILQNLMLDTTPEAKRFRDNSRAYNSSLAFTSLGAKTPAVPGHGPPVFQIQGTVYYRRRIDTKTCKSIASFFSKRGHNSEQNSVTLTTTVPVVPSCPVPIEAEVVINHDVTTTPPLKKACLTLATSPVKGKTKQQGFTKAWLMQFDAIDNSMHCKLCRKQRGDGVWVTGTRNFRVKTVIAYITGKVSSILHTPCQRILLSYNIACQFIVQAQ